MTSKSSPLLAVSAGLALAFSPLALSTAVYAQSTSTDAGTAQSAPATSAPAQASSQAGAAKITAAHNRFGKQNRRGPRTGAQRGRGLLALACTPKAAERLDARLTKIGTRLDLTATQKPLFEAFRSDFLTAQTEFADACATPRTNTQASKKMDLPQRLAQRQENLKARTAAMDKVLPSFTAMFESLDKNQLSALHQVRPRSQRQDRHWGGPAKRDGREHNRDGGRRDRDGNA